MTYNEQRAGAVAATWLLLSVAASVVLWGVGLAVWL